MMVADLRQQFFFASSFGPGAWVVTGEMFPLKMRAKCLSMTTAANWFCNWLIAYIIPYMIGTDYADLGSNVFWIWGGFCWIAAFFVYFLIYETKGLSLEQVNELYENCGQAWRSNKVRESMALTADEAMAKQRKLKPHGKEEDKPDEEKRVETIE